MTPLSEGIGSLNESTLHAQIKDWYARPQDRFEVKVDGSIIDIVRGPLLVEIQTSNFAALRKKLDKLIEHRKVRVVYPLPRNKWVIRVSEMGNILGKRRSPKAGKITDAFEELLRIPELINHPNFSLEILVVDIEEIRSDDGKGSRWRRGVSIKDRRLVEVLESIEFTRSQDFLRFLPDNLKSPFTNKILAKAMGISSERATQITYTLRRMSVLEVVGKERNSYLFDVVI